MGSKIVKKTGINFDVGKGTKKSQFSCIPVSGPDFNVVWQGQDSVENEL